MGKDTITMNKHFKEFSKEGSVTYMQIFRDILVWANKDKLRVTYYPDSNFENDDKKKGICYITNDKCTLPSHFAPPSPPNNVTPSVTFLKSTKTENKNQRNYSMITTWSNMIKINELTYDKASDKYAPDTSYKQLIITDNVFVASSCLIPFNFSQEILFISLMFDYQDVKEGEEPVQSPKLGLIKQNELIDYVRSPEQILKRMIHTDIDFLGGTKFQDYQFIMSGQNNGMFKNSGHPDYLKENQNFFVSNPLSVYKVVSKTVKDILELNQMLTEADETRASNVINDIIKRCEENRQYEYKHRQVTKKLDS